MTVDSVSELLLMAMRMATYSSCVKMNTVISLSRCTPFVCNIIPKTFVHNIKTHLFVWSREIMTVLEPLHHEDDCRHDLWSNVPQSLQRHSYSQRTRTCKTCHPAQIEQPETINLFACTMITNLRDFGLAWHGIDTVMECSSIASRHGSYKLVVNTFLTTISLLR